MNFKNRKTIFVGISMGETEAPRMEFLWIYFQVSEEIVNYIERQE